MPLQAECESPWGIERSCGLSHLNRAHDDYPVRVNPSGLKANCREHGPRSYPRHDLKPTPSLRYLTRISILASWPTSPPLGLLCSGFPSSTIPATHKGSVLLRPGQENLELPYFQAISQTPLRLPAPCFPERQMLTTGQGDWRMMEYALVRNRPIIPADEPRPITTKSASSSEAAEEIAKGMLLLSAI
jgi:hypothetical protein